MLTCGENVLRTVTVAVTNHKKTKTLIIKTVTFAIFERIFAHRIIFMLCKLDIHIGKLIM